MYKVVLGFSCGFLGRPGACCSFLARPGWISWGLLGCPGASTGESCGFLGPLARFWLPPAGFWRFSRACCCFLGPPAVFAASCGFLTLPRAGVLVGLLRVSGAPAVFWGLLGFLPLPMASLGRHPGLAFWQVESSRMPHCLGTLQTVSQLFNRNSLVEQLTD